MARAFASGSSQYLIHNAAVVAAPPFSFACWCKPASVAAFQAIMALGVNGGAHRHVLGVQNDATVLAQSVDAGSGTATAPGTVSVGAWAHLGAIFSSAASRQAVLNGTLSAANTSSINPTGLNRTLIGARISTTVGSFASADLAECAIWNVGLTQDEWSALAKGISPLLVRPEALLAYWPLIGRSSPEPDRIGGFDMTLTNGPANAAHSRIIMPRKAHS